MFNKGILDESRKSLGMGGNTDELTTIYEALSPGGIFEFQYDSNIDILGLGDRLRKPPTQLKFFIDVVGWTAPFRAWTKWWLNPRAWWNPSRYKLDESTDITWNEEEQKATVTVSDKKDLDFIYGQTLLYVWQYWGFDKFSPYILQDTHEVFDKATRLSFSNLDQPLLEAAGFTGVRMFVWKNPRTHRVERVVQATKPL